MLLIGLILGLLLYPVIARAVTFQEPGRYPQPSETFGYALEARGIKGVPAMVGAIKSPEDTDADKATSHESVALSAPSVAHKMASQSNVEMLSYIRLKESGGNPTAQNPRSSAYGLYGFLDSTWVIVGCIKTSDPIEQERCAVKYMEQRYGGVEGAYYFHLRNNYY